MRKKKSDNVRKRMFDNNGLKDSNINRNFQIELKNGLSVLQEKGDVTIATFNKAVRQTAEKNRLPKEVPRTMDIRRNMEQDRKEEEDKDQMDADKIRPIERSTEETL